MQDDKKSQFTYKKQLLVQIYSLFDTKTQYYRQLCLTYRNIFYQVSIKIIKNIKILS